MTWNATLPQDRSTTANQSDLYAAAWFGLVVSDPAAWLGQCYVELQLYPDFNWSSPTTTVAGDWSGAIVGWQIDPASGNVDTCYYSQLYKHGVPSDGPFSMREGDTFSVTLRGYASDPAGENVSITDTNSTAVSTANLFNTTGNFPLNPAYPTNEFQNALLWTSGGQLPITFGFEIGREGNPGGVANSTFQGCTPGPFSPSRADPSTPCPSYDPLSWVNDTMTPWEIGTPTFFSGSQLSSPSEVDFSSTVAGGSSILSSSNETCLNRVGSSYCTYPWFGYSCTSSTFTFGATDYASESNDFGQAAEYSALPTTNLIGQPMYGPLNFSIPACGSSTYTVTLGTSGVAGGHMDFLSATSPPSSAVTGVTPGSYAIRAPPPTGAGFDGWSVTGKVAVNSPTSPSAVLAVTG
ncbi:MAG: hypothetical protein WB809_07395, partial [Thermoplasmata archaeon]